LYTENFVGDVLPRTTNEVLNRAVKYETARGFSGLAGIAITTVCKVGEKYCAFK